MQINRKSITATLLALMVFSVSFAQQTAVKYEQTETKDTSPSHHIYFSNSDKYSAPRTQELSNFDCNDKVYTVLELHNYPQEKHRLSVKWINPHGITSEHTQYSFHVHSNYTKVWAWLGLRRAQGAGMLQFINPDAGLENFIGEWVIEVRVNGKKLEPKSKTLTVHC